MCGFDVARPFLCLAMSLVLAYSAAHEIKCVQPKSLGGGKLRVCNYTEKWRTARVCCYNAELDYHYCCPINEFRSMSHGTRMAGASAASVLIILIIFLLCFFSKRCPIRDAINKRRPNEQVSSDVASV